MKAWANKRMDASFGDWWFGVRASLFPGRTDPTPRVELLWEPSGAGIAGLSVRSLFDLWLSVQDWEAGDRIVFTALTVADMGRIARDHGFQVAAVDIDPMTGEPDLALLRDLINDRTRAVVYTHLFGARGDVTGAIDIARANGVQFVEDCAEAYAGPDWRGHPLSDLALFSFGPIKTATAFGGGLARVPDAVVRDDMRMRASLLPEQTRFEYLTRLVKFGSVGAVTAPHVFGKVVRLLDLAGPGHDRVLQRLTRGFPGPEFFMRIRRRPARPLLRLLERRLGQGDMWPSRRIAAGEHLMARLAGLRLPMVEAEEHRYWLVPVLAPDPDALVGRLAAAGFHATRGRAFAVLDHDEGVNAPKPNGAHELHLHGVFLPFAPEMPGDVLDELADLVRDEVSSQEHSQRVARPRRVPRADDLTSPGFPARTV